MGQARTSLHCRVRRPHDPLHRVSEDVHASLPNPAPRFRQIRFVDFEADKFFHAAALRSNR